MGTPGSAIGTRRSVVAIYLAVVIMLPTAVVEAASVALANGEVVEGSIQGFILLDRTRIDANGVKGSPVFRIVEGKDILRIDASGVVSEGETVILLSVKGSATVAETVQGVVWWDAGRALKKNQALVRDVGKGQVTGARMDASNVRPMPEVLIGEFTVNHSEKAIEFSGSIRLKRPDGQIVTIPVSGITKFTQQAP